VKKYIAFRGSLWGVFRRGLCHFNRNFLQGALPPAPRRCRVAASGGPPKNTKGTPVGNKQVTGFQERIYNKLFVEKYIAFRGSL